MDQNNTPLVEAFLQLKTQEEVERFLSDLCTPQEKHALEERWRVCQELASPEKPSYREIHALTSASLTTIGRVARFLNQESYGGYQLVLKRLQKRNKK